MRAFLVIPFLLCTQAVAADVSAIVDDHILPRFERLAATTDQLAKVAATDCDPESADLRGSYHAAFDAWVAASHLRFGPTETGERAFALAFWPDPRGATPKVLSQLLADSDPVVDDAASFASVSIAGRGFYALEFLLFDDQIMVAGTPDYHCKLVQAIADDIDQTADAIWQDWSDRYAALLKTAGTDGNATYQTREEAIQELYKALTTGLQFTSDARVGRPLGTFDKPRPRRAEARRSNRSLRHVVLSLQNLRDLARDLAAEDETLTNTVSAAFDEALARADVISDPSFADINDPQARLRLEILQQHIDAIREIHAANLGAHLGVSAGFNALDGD